MARYPALVFFLLGIAGLINCTGQPHSKQDQRYFTGALQQNSEAGSFSEGEDEDEENVRERACRDASAIEDCIGASKDVRELLPNCIGHLSFITRGFLNKSFTEAVLEEFEDDYREHKDELEREFRLCTKGAEYSNAKDFKKIKTCTLGFIREVKDRVDCP